MPSAYPPPFHLLYYKKYLFKFLYENYRNINSRKKINKYKCSVGKSSTLVFGGSMTLRFFFFCYENLY